MEGTTHSVTLAQGSDLAAMMLMAQESIISLEEDGLQRKVRFWFDDDQQIVCTLYDYVLIGVTVTLCAGKQPSIKALEDVHEAATDQSIPIFQADGLTHYDVAGLSDWFVLLNDMSELSKLLDGVLVVLKEVSVRTKYAENRYNQIKHILNAETVARGATAG
jgi:hypothetical protein